METVKVYSTINDPKIKTNLNESPIWKSAIHETDLASVEAKHNDIWEYSIKFDGVKAIQFLKSRKYK